MHQINFISNWLKLIEKLSYHSTANWSLNPSIINLIPTRYALSRSGQFHLPIFSLPRSGFPYHKLANYEQLRWKVNRLPPYPAEHHICLDSRDPVHLRAGTCACNGHHACKCFCIGSLCNTRFVHRFRTWQSGSITMIGLDESTFNGSGPFGYYANSLAKIFLKLSFVYDPRPYL